MPKILKLEANSAGFDDKWYFDAVHHAITSYYPKTRYTSSPPGTVAYWV